MAHMTTTDVSLGELVGQAKQELTTLVHQEVALAKLEVAKAGKGAGMLGGAGVVALYGVGFLLLAATFGLGAVMPLGWAAAIVAVVCLAIAGILALTGKRAITTLKEDAPWARR
jgi:hypothetical protein